MLNLLSQIEYATKLIITTIFCLILFINASCSNTGLQLKSNAQAVRTPVTQINSAPGGKDDLRQLAIRLTKLYEDKNCEEFFNEFPNTFQEFNEMYRYSSKEEAQTLFSKSSEHFPYFFSCSGISNDKKLEKAIKIGIGGKYDDEAPIGIFQDSTFDLVKKYPDDSKEILDNLSDEKASSFWYYLFDRPEPSDKANKKKVILLSEILGKDSKQSKLLTEQYQKLLVDWSEH